MENEQKTRPAMSEREFSAELACQIAVRFPWVLDDEDEDVCGSDTIGDLANWYADLTGDPDAIEPV